MEREALISELHQLRDRLNLEQQRAGSRHDPFGHLLQRLVVQADPEQPEALDEQLLEQLRETVAEQSIDHPQLSGAARQLLDILSRMGV